MKNEENFLRFVLRFVRGLLLKRSRLSYRLSNSVVWKPQKFRLILKKLVREPIVWKFEFLLLYDYNLW